MDCRSWRSPKNQLKLPFHFSQRSLKMDWTIIHSMIMKPHYVSLLIMDHDSLYIYIFFILIIWIIIPPFPSFPSSKFSTPWPSSPSCQELVHGMRQILQGAQVDTLIVAELARRHISVILRKKRTSGDPLGEDQPCWFVEKSPIYETVSTCYMYIVYIIYTLIYIYNLYIYNQI